MQILNESSIMKIHFIVDVKLDLFYVEIINREKIESTRRNIHTRTLQIILLSRIIKVNVLVFML
jgi:hypothetical protein